MDTPSKNVVKVTGQLSPVRERGKEHTTGTRRSPTGAILDRFSLQVESPYAEPFGLNLEAGMRAEGLDLFDSAKIGDTVVVEGFLRIVNDVDDRYITADNAQGRRYRELRLVVERVRSLAEDEPAYGSLVQLTGTVMIPPRTDRHPTVPDLDLATTEIEVVMDGLPAYPGSKMTFPTRYRVPVTIPVTHEHAANMYRVGNVVEVEGALDRTIVPQRGDAVEARSKELRETFEREAANLRGQARKDAERVYRRDQRQLIEAPRAIVTAGYVALLSGTPQEYAEAEKEREQYTKQLKAAREQWQSNNRPRVAALPNPEVLALADGVDAAEVVTIAPLPDAPARPRRRREEPTSAVVAVDSGNSHEEAPVSVA